MKLSIFAELVDYISLWNNFETAFGVSSIQH